jgi:RimJ/RimL family protein N-acetyltransferase
VNQFLATDVRQLAAWMCEEDCRAFGWPPSSAMPQNQIQHFWWSFNEFGEQIRKQIRERFIILVKLYENK